VKLILYTKADASFATLLPSYKSTRHRSPQYCNVDVITVETKN